MENSQIQAQAAPINDSPAEDAARASAQDLTANDSFVNQDLPGQQAEPAANPENAGSAQPDPDDAPIRDFAKLDLGLPDDMQVDPQLVASLGKVAMREGLTPRQARALAQWNLEATRRETSELLENGTADLRKSWGKNADNNQQAAIALVSRIDRAMEQAGSPAGAFSSALQKSGASLHADIIKGLFTISQWLSEDATGLNPATAQADRPETILQGLQDAFNKAHSGR